MKEKTKKHLIESPDRRSFIRTATAGVASVGIASAMTGCAEESAEATNEYDIIVIGGGFAGVTAARDSSNRGHRTLLLEARARLGGRTFTSSFGGHDDIDLGGTWMGWSQPHVWSQVMQYRMPIGETASSGMTKANWMDGGKLVSGDPGQWMEIFERSLNKYYALAQQAFPRPFDPLYTDAKAELDNINAREAIEQMDMSPLERDFALSIAGINGHSDPSESSYLDQLRWFALGDLNVWNLWGNLGTYKIKGGTKKLLDAMHADGEATTKLSSAVASVHQGEAGVTVTTKRGEVYRARAVIVAVPLNCVADIEFSPGISDVKARVSTERHTGSGTKVYVHIKKGLPVQLGSGTWDMPLNMLWTEYDDPDSQVLCGFGCSPEHLDINDDDAVADAVHRFMPEAELISSFGYDWNLDPYSKGTWCMYRPNVLTQDLEELQRSEGSVYFAGADIADGWRGFIEGAIESGMRVARDVDVDLS